MSSLGRPGKSGKSLQDWGIYSRSNNDLIGFKTPIDVTLQELSQHNKEEDCWIALNGRVYCITKYLDYHPGGKDILVQASGKDATALFNKNHSWVNFTAMLEPCYIGRLVQSNMSRGGVTQSEFRPLFFWSETKETVLCDIRGVFLEPVLENISVISLNKQSVYISLRMVSRKYYVTEFNLFSLVKRLQVSSKNEKNATIEFSKHKTVLWNRRIADLVKDYGEMEDQYIIKQMPKKLKLVRKSFISSNIIQLTFQYPNLCYFSVPIGYHVCLCDDKDETIYRPYTVTPSSLTCRKYSVPETIESPTLTFIIKIYPNGRFTPRLVKFDKGKALTALGPFGEFDAELLSLKEIVYLIAAGTGITPMLRIISYLFAISDMTSIKLIVSSKLEKDIIWRYQLEALAEQEKRFHVDFIISEPESNWKGLSGKLDAQKLKSLIPLANKDIPSTLFLLSGPKSFVEDIEGMIRSLFTVKPFIYSFI